jgi:hypothetical protein
MLARVESNMHYGWLIYVGFAVAYTWIVFRVPVADDLSPIWSNQNLMPREWIVLIHSVFLAAYLGLICFLTWRESSFGWLTRGSVDHHPGTFDLIFVAVWTGVIECLLLYRGPEPSPPQNESDSTDEN